MATLLVRVKNFGRNGLKRGVSALALVMECVDHMVDTGDQTPLVWMLTSGEDDVQRKSRKIVGKVTSGLTLKKSDNKALNNHRLVKADNWGVTEEMITLRRYVEGGHNMFERTTKDGEGKTVGDWLSDGKQAEVQVNVKEAVVKFAKRLADKDANITLATLLEVLLDLNNTSLTTINTTVVQQDLSMSDDPITDAIVEASPVVAPKARRTRKASA